MVIGVIGGSKCSRKAAKLAEEVGRELATQQATVICGGLGGVMEAVCRGAKEAGGQTLGILPGNDRSDANPYVDIPIVTGMGEMRNVVIIKSAQALIAIDGEYGTLSEIGHALKRGVPVIGLNTWEISRKGKADDSIIIAEDAKDAVQKALKAITP
ncbi:MAG: TIGR00725 family protein [Dehalococcoidia bacterium]|nr:TIGR00725 family protein [Dehalococcoidia bacterium]